MSTNGSGDVLIDTKIIQVSNVAPQANKDQLQSLFNYVGKIEEMKLYPTARDVTMPVQVRICFIKFTDSSMVGVAQHMTNTVFIDRALIVAPYFGSKIPDEIKGLEILNSGGGQGLTEPKLPPTVTNQIDGIPPNQVIQTFDPRLALHNLPPYPPLPASTDSRRVEEIRRTLVAINIDPLLTAQEVMNFFSSAGEIKYFRFCSREGDVIRYAMIEYSEQESIVGALKLNSKQLGENIVKVHHSTQAIVKPVPQNKSNEAAQKEIEEAVNRVKEAQQSILSTVLSDSDKEKDKKRSRSRSRSHHRSSSRRRSRSRSRKRRSRSRSRRRSRSRSRSRDRRKRSKSRERRRRSRSRDRGKKSRSKSKSRSRSRTRRSRDKDRRDKSKDREKKDKDKDKDKEKDKEKKDRERRKKDKKDKDRSPARDGSAENKHERERKKKSRSPSKTKKSSRRSRSGSRGRSR